MMLRVAQIVPCTEAEGPGKRFALWFQGCPLRCPGCCNPEMLPFEGGTPMDIADVIIQLRQSTEQHGLEGITLLGGEPLAHAAGAAALARAAHELGLNVMAFTGHLLEDIRQMADPDVQELLAETDMLVDGPYLRELPETTRRWIGSSNQRVHYLSDRCDPADPRWLQRNTLEIRLRHGELSVNGFPARQAIGLWKPPRVLNKP
jgi:anaerobic ribonucleoside-triphosphate reductase activating protein